MPVSSFRGKEKFVRRIGQRLFAPTPQQLCCILKPHLLEPLGHQLRLLLRRFVVFLRMDVGKLNNTNFHTADLFGLWVAPGFHETEHYTAYPLQGGLQLPDRENHLSQSERMKNLRLTYQVHIAAMQKLGGFGDTEARAARILELEHALAEKHLRLAENKDIHAANNTWKRTEFTAKAQGLDWAEYCVGRA